jgi:glycosyltransferase involved in cell wall biosynthesis
MSNNPYLKELGKKTLPFFPRLDFWGQGRIQAGMGIPYTIFKMNAVKWDIFHPTMDSGVVKYANYMHAKKPMVITAHDTLPYLFHKNNPKREGAISSNIKMSNRADKIIAISENTKRDYINYYGADERKIEVIHHGISKQRQPIYDQRMELNPYILFVGIREMWRFDYKNFLRFAKAFSIVSAKFPSLRLICTGSPCSLEEKKELTALNIFDKTRFIFATEQGMGQLYHDAEMFVYPSIYEGFGMPILEAMLYDCPLVLSNTSCFPEIAQNAGLYFNPYDVDDMADKITTMLLDSELRKEHIKRGQKRLTHFSWEKCAEEHIKVYKSLL